MQFKIKGISELFDTIALVGYEMITLSVFCVIQGASWIINLNSELFLLTLTFHGNNDISEMCQQQQN